MLCTVNPTIYIAGEKIPAGYRLEITILMFYLCGNIVVLINVLMWLPALSGLWTSPADLGKLEMFRYERGGGSFTISAPAPRGNPTLWRVVVVWACAIREKPSCAGWLGKGKSGRCLAERGDFSWCAAWLQPGLAGSQHWWELPHFMRRSLGACLAAEVYLQLTV